MFYLQSDEVFQVNHDFPGYTCHKFDNLKPFHFRLQWQRHLSFSAISVSAESAHGPAIFNFTGIRFVLKTPFPRIIVSKYLISYWVDLTKLLIMKIDI